MAPAGWYDDPHDPAAYRWWDGLVWSRFTHDRAAAAPPGWYMNPEGSGATAWWDGTAWVEQIEVIDLRELGAELGQTVVLPVDVHHAPGWYADPRDVESWRWWDGASWTDHTRTTATLV